MDTHTQKISNTYNPSTAHNLQPIHNPNRTQSSTLHLRHIVIGTGAGLCLQALRTFDKPVEVIHSLFNHKVELPEARDIYHMFINLVTLMWLLWIAWMIKNYLTSQHTPIASLTPQTSSSSSGENKSIEEVSSTQSNTPSNSIQEVNETKNESRLRGWYRSLRDLSLRANVNFLMDRDVTEINAKNVRGKLVPAFTTKVFKCWTIFPSADVEVRHCINIERVEVREIAKGATLNLHVCYNLSSLEIQKNNGTLILPIAGYEMFNALKIKGKGTIEWK